jgi:hypothetical protein
MIIIRISYAAALMRSSCSGGSSLPLLKDDLLKLLPLPLGTEVSAQSLLEELESPLFSGHFQELHAPTLIWSEANNFTHDVTDEFVVGSDALKKVPTNQDMANRIQLFAATEHHIKVLNIFAPFRPWLPTSK